MRHFADPRVYRLYSLCSLVEVDVLSAGIVERFKDLRKPRPQVHTFAHVHLGGHVKQVLRLLRLKGHSAEESCVCI